MEANYWIDAETKNIILQLIKTAESVNLGNVLFTDYKDQADFSLNEMLGFWQLIVNCKNIIDTYKIKDGVMEYTYTEYHDQ